MKKTVFPHTVAFLISGLMAPLSAQNLVSTQNPSEIGLKADGTSGSYPRFTEASALPGTYEVPAVEKAQGDVYEGKPAIASQDSLTLDAKSDTSRNVESVVNLDMLRNPSPYRRMAVSTGGKPYEIEANSLQNGLALISATYRESGKSEKSTDCSAIALAVEQRIRLDTSKVLEIVELEVGANPGCACEIVKTAIKASEAGTNQVVSIAEAAIQASPESMRIISQCAIATMPESISGVQALLTRLDPNAGEAGYSSKSAKSGKDAKVAAIIVTPPPNPLDRPLPPVIPPITPIPVTEVNPCVSRF